VVICMTFAPFGSTRRLSDLLPSENMIRNILVVQHFLTNSPASLEWPELTTTSPKRANRRMYAYEKIDPSDAGNHSDRVRHQPGHGCPEKGQGNGTAGVLSHSKGRWTLHLLQRSRAERRPHYSFVARPSVVVAYVSAVANTSC